MHRTPLTLNPPRASAAVLALLVFLQMLPATMLGPAIRPLFAARHAGHEGAMHAFLALGMLGALVLTPIVARLLDRGDDRRARRALRALALADAALIVMMAAPWPTSSILVLRTIEGGVHVATSTLLLAAASRLDGPRDGRSISLAGGALLAAVALGSALGGTLARASIDLPFVVGAALAALVGVLGPLALPAREVVAPRPTTPARVPWRTLVPWLGAAFVERFGVGCMVVTFSLLARSQHGLDDAAIGVLYAAMTLPFALAMVPLGRLASERTRRAAIVIGGLGYGAALVSLAFAPVAALPAAMIGGGLASAGLYAPALREVAERTALGARARAMGAFHVAGAVGMLLGPAAAGITSALVGAQAGALAGRQAALVLGGAAVISFALTVAAVWARARTSAPAGIGTDAAEGQGAVA